ncbi:hypothetical protein V6N12_035764 [Hibiscus sabdariffa]|uniref:Uncharacterized protein n=1 Tax=Hibiscus sabdariffa TaxID=183260 RepID=A0ABR2ENQ3_9ROSI
MLVECRGRKSICKETKPPNDKFGVRIEGSRFNPIFDVDGEETLAASKEQSILPSSSLAILTAVSACVPASPRVVPNQGMDFEVPIENVNVDIAAPRNLGKKPDVPRPLRSTISPPVSHDQLKKSVSPPKSSVSLPIRKPFVLHNIVCASSSKGVKSVSHRSSSLSTARFALFGRRLPAVDKSKHTYVVINENGDPNPLVNIPQADIINRKPVKPPDSSVRVANTDSMASVSMGVSSPVRVVHDTGVPDQSAM